MSHDDDFAAAGDDLRDTRQGRAPEDVFTWETASSALHDEHRLFCAHGCAWCDGHRDFGRCTHCGGDDREFDDGGLCLTCHHGTHDPVDYDEDHIHRDAA